MLMYRQADSLNVIGYSDSNFAGCVNSQKSTSGYIFILADGAISWRSEKQTVVTTSTIQPEFVLSFKATCHDE